MLDDMIAKIMRLKKERNAVFLVHNYQRPEVQDIADFLGDSLGLAQQAAKTDADVIVFCGVHFMAETAAILSPEKTVLLPDEHAGCPMADMITADKLRQKKQGMPGAAVVCYVNTSAVVKAESDICCTSANAVKVVQSLPGDEVLFVPDQYLGHFVSTQTDKKMTFWPGYCPTHAKIQAEDIMKLRQKHPGVPVVVHPECRPDVIAAADEALSTGGMVRYAASGDVTELIVGTELGILHRLRKENPSKTFIPISELATCTNMKKITFLKILDSLETMAPVVTVPEDIRLKALASVVRMLEVS
ncbi:quinolinate synthase NadA [Chloroflexota bacterium]